MKMWLPIETAPKDETDIIVAEGGLVSVAFFDTDEGKWLDSMNHDGYEHARRRPTHWMPLPDPPTATIPVYKATSDDEGR
jgi:hypothetical protein